MKQAKQVGQGYAPEFYKRVTATQYAIWHRGGIERAVKRLEVERDDMLFCQRWLLANIEPGPVGVYRVNFELLKYMFDVDAAPRAITPGAFQVALFRLGYPTLPTFIGEMVGCTAASVREVCRRQANGGYHG